MKLTSDICAKSGIFDNKKVETLEVVSTNLRLEDGTLLEDHIPYRQLIRFLIFLSIIRSDIAHVVHVVSQFQHAPTTVHMSVVLRIIRYIKNSIRKRVFLSSSSSLDLCAYTNADWGRNPNDRISTTDFCIFLRDSLIS
jgi:hypothetical protein